MIMFTKLHGNGNDFILLDEYDREVIPDDKKGDFAGRFCDRQFGIGADGVLFLLVSRHANLKMRIFNPDGSEAEMCGNGIRCLVKYAIDAGYIGLGTVTVETVAGDMTIKIREGSENQIWAKVDMGEPRFEFLEKDIMGMKVSAVNTGVPHAVIFVPELFRKESPKGSLLKKGLDGKISDFPCDIESLPIMEIAPKIRHNPIFPNGTNVNFVKVEGGSIKIRTYERGIEAETLSCGTGAVASAVVANKLGMVGDDVTVKAKGGELCISLEDGRAFMGGKAETVYEGIIRYTF